MGCVVISCNFLRGQKLEIPDTLRMQAGPA